MDNIPNWQITILALIVLGAICSAIYLKFKSRCVNVEDLRNPDPPDIPDKVSRQGPPRARPEAPPPPWKDTSTE